MGQAEAAPTIRTEVNDLERWEDIASCFGDANLFQTRAYASIAYGAKNVSTIVVRKNGEPVSAALARIVRIPKLPLGIAHVFWGPLWKKNARADIEEFRLGVHALIEEYVIRRGLILRIRPFLYEDETSGPFKDLFHEIGFRPVLYLPQKKTFLINLAKPINELRAGLDGKWRGHLNRAEKNNLMVVEGTESQLFDRFHPIHKELLEKKELSDIKSVHIFKNIQSLLPEHLKMRLFLCEHGGKVCAGIVVSSIGDIGITLARATNDLGRQQGAAYIMHWRALQWIKSQECHWYDLSGADKLLNPGNFSYKAGFCGKNGREIKMLPQYQICKGRLKEIVFNFIERTVHSLS
jgi:hypothetical protein